MKKYQPKIKVEEEKEQLKEYWESDLISVINKAKIQKVFNDVYSRIYDGKSSINWNTKNLIMIDDFSASDKVDFLFTYNSPNGIQEGKLTITLTHKGLVMDIRLHT